MEKDSPLNILELIKNMISDGFLLTDLKGIIIDCNEIFANYFDEEPKALIGIDIKNSLEKDEYLFTSKFFEEMPSQKQIFHKAVFKVNNQIRMLNLNIALLYDNNNKPIEILFLIREIQNNSISKNSLSEKMLRNNTELYQFLVENTRNLKNVEIKFQVLFENAPISITLLDKSGCIIDCNKSTEGLIGYSKEVILGTHFEDLMTLNTKDISKLISQYEKLVNGQEVAPFDIEITTKSGEKRWVNILISISSKERDVKGFQIIANDITEKKVAEEKMENLIEKIKNQNKRLQELDGAKDEMLEIVSHELRTPLVSILGFIELLSINDANLTADQIEQIKILRRNADRLNQLIENFFSLDKLDQGRFILKIQKIDLHNLIKSALWEASYRLKQKMHNIFLEIPPKSEIKVDEELIHQVISNLLNNAIKYTPERGAICIKTKKYGEKLIFSIKDSGIGIEKEYLPTLFQKFQRIPYSNESCIGDVKGIGLGLYISKKIIELHGGKIWAESEGINKGSTFYFELPNQF